MRWNLAKVGVAAVLVLAAVVGGRVFWRYRQDRLSPEVRNAFCAATSSKTSEAEVTYYTRKAKLASRTGEDSRLVSLLEAYYRAGQDLLAAKVQMDEDFGRTVAEGLKAADPNDPCKQPDLDPSMRSGCAAEAQMSIRITKLLIADSKANEAKARKDAAALKELAPRLKHERAKYCAGSP